MYKIYFNPLNGKIIPSQEYFEYDQSFHKYWLIDLKNTFGFKDFDELFNSPSDKPLISILSRMIHNISQIFRMKHLLSENTKLSFAQNYDKKWYVCCWLEFNSKEEMVFYLLKN